MEPPGIVRSEQDLVTFPAGLVTFPADLVTFPADLVTFPPLLLVNSGKFSKNLTKSGPFPPIPPVLGGALVGPDI